MGKREKMLLYKEIVTREIKLLSYADRCVILIIEKGKARNTRPTHTITLACYNVTAVTIASSGGYFLPLKIV